MSLLLLKFLRRWLALNHIHVHIHTLSLTYFSLSSLCYFTVTRVHRQLTQDPAVCVCLAQPWSAEARQRAAPGKYRNGQQSGEFEFGVSFFFFTLFFFFFFEIASANCFEFQFFYIHKHSTPSAHKIIFFKKNNIAGGGARAESQRLAEHVALL
jgi:hypothetical protein